jgi:ADP-heptose:LPS heptosyltransferase
MKKIAENKAREVGLEDYDVFNPSLLCTQYHKRVFWHPEFQLLQEPPLAPKLYDLVFHLRAINKAGPGPSKNYPPAKAEQLARRCLDSGLSVCCIGHPEYSYCPAGCADYRNIDLRQTVAGICSGRLGVGGSSGAMHLINVCGKPTVTWGDPAALRWNPFLVPIHMLGDTAWQPDPDEVHRAVLIAFEELRQKTFQFTRPAYTLPGRQISPI